VKQNQAVDVGMIRRAHGRFLEAGSAPRGLVPEFIENSWARSHRAGVEADRVRELARLSDIEFRHAEQAHVDFITEATPVLEHLYEEIADTGSIVLLCGPDGLILKAMGDPVFLQRAERVALAPGVNWAEHAKGTNAIGTAIVERSPVTVYAAQHYVQHHHFLTCSASPILDAAGEVAGVLDITGDYRAHQVHTIALVKMAAQMIERQVFRRQYRNDVVLRMHRRANFLGSIYDAQVAFSLDGSYLAGSAAAANVLGRFDLGPQLCFRDLFDTHLDHALAEIRRADHGICRLRSRDGSHVHIRIDVAPPSRTASRPGDLMWRPASGEVPRGQPSRPAGTLECLRQADPTMSALLDKARRVIGRDIPILIQGETGSGKEWVARGLHDAGPRAGRPFVAVNCAAIPEGLIESELFGYDEGAFTGAKRKGMPGRVLQADGGTLFLDEIGDMPLSLQTRLLRVLQDRTVSPLGAARPVAVDIAVMCATHRNISLLVSEGRFREDLYYRLNGITIQLPALRQRLDLRALVESILAEECLGQPAPVIDDPVWEIFRAHPWPGNVRQLQSVLRTATALMDDDRIIRFDCLPDGFADGLAAPVVASAQSALACAESGGVEPVSLEAVERVAIQRALEVHGGNVSAAARALGIGRNTLYRKLGNRPVSG
jgi:transcriptional regulator of acetoin/glycerol metabolism